MQSSRAFVEIIVLAAWISWAGCGAPSDSPKPAGDQASPSSRLQDGPLTAEARKRVAALGGEPTPATAEAYQALSRLGRDAVPALVGGLQGDSDERAKLNMLMLLGDLGLASFEAKPWLEDFSVTGPGRLAAAATQAVHRIGEAAACGLPGLPRDAELHLVGRYQGAKELDLQLGDSGHTVTEIVVVVDRTAHPLVLVLTAYDPVVWKVGLTPEANLAGVLVAGYHTQALLGIPASVPHKVISSEQSLGCDAFHASSAAEVTSVERQVIAYTGHRIDEFHGASATDDYLVGGGPATRREQARFSNDLSLDDYPVYRGDIPAGPRGIEELARQGRIRAATREDIEAWQAGAKEAGAVTSLHPDGVYVVLEEITLPPGLFGAHSRAFIVPAGVPKPKGPKGHCQFLLMSDHSRE